MAEVYHNQLFLTTSSDGASTRRNAVSEGVTVQRARVPRSETQRVQIASHLSLVLYCTSRIIR